MAVVFFAICGDFYVESMVSEQLDVSTMVITSLTSSFGAAILVEQITGIGEWSMLTVLCFLLTLIGMHILFKVIFFFCLFMFYFETNKHIT